MTKSKLFGREVLHGSVENLKSALLTLSSSESAFFCNVHMLMLSQEDSALAQAMDRATLVFPDGVPVAWLQRAAGHSEADVLRGYEAMELLCATAAVANEPIGLFGSTAEVLDALSSRLREKHLGLSIDFVHAPPHFSSLDFELDSSLIQEINSRRLRYLFVGLGCPKQELWIDRYASELNCTLLGVGAAFDWLAGATPQPPYWMEISGLAWLHRLVLNPRKMWRRYLKYNTKFVIASTKLLLRHSFTKK